MRVSFRFYGHLNAFLPPLRRGFRFVEALRAPSSVKDAMSALGVSDGEIDLVLVNSAPVDLGYALADGDRVAVYPPFRSIDLGDVVRAHDRT